VTFEQVRASLFLGRAADSMSAHRGAAGAMIDLAIAATMALLVIGVSLPFIVVNRLFVFTDAHSLLEISATLLAEQETLLAGVVFMFSILIPAGKLLLLHHAWSVAAMNDGRLLGQLRLLEFVGKWSMLEVFVGALVVFAVKASWLGDAATGPGVYCFAAAALLTTLLAHVITRAFSSRDNGGGAAAGRQTLSKY
jgi:paraquat-inducible protein A